MSFYSHDLYVCTFECTTPEKRNEEALDFIYLLFPDCNPNKSKCKKDIEKGRKLRQKFRNNRDEYFNEDDWTYDYIEEIFLEFTSKDLYIDNLMNYLGHKNPNKHSEDDPDEITDYIVISSYID